MVRGNQRDRRLSVIGGLAHDAHLASSASTVDDEQHEGETVDENLANILVVLFGVEGSQITRAMTWDDLEMDTQDLPELLAALHEAFLLRIPAADVEQWKTVGDLHDYLARKGVL